MGCDKVLKGELENALVFIRPPGHHSAGIINDLQGFCILNNVAIAANHLLNEGVKKVLILDWDIHHGDSTQKIFYETKKVLYISIHKFLKGEFYPNNNSDVGFLGSGEGKGYNLNFPLNPKVDDDYIGD